MSKTEEQRLRNQNGPRSLLRDRAVLSLYALMVAFAMGGWLWFLGRLSWHLVTRAVSALS